MIVTLLDIGVSGGPCPFSYLQLPLPRVRPFLILPPSGEYIATVLRNAICHINCFSSPKEVAAPAKKMAQTIINHPRYNRSNPTQRWRTQHLLSLPCRKLGLGQLLLPSRLRRLSTSLGVEAEVPPPEAAGVVANELLVVNIVVLSAGPEREEVVQAPGKLVSAVRIDGLEHTESNPAVHGEDVKILCDGTPDDRATDSTETENHDFDGRGILSSKTERSRILVVNLVNVLVEERAGVHQTVGPVVPGILHNEEDRDLVGHLVQRRERDVGFETEVLAHRVE